MRILLYFTFLYYLNGFTEVGAKEVNSIKIAWLDWPPLGSSQLKSQGIIPDILMTVLRDAGYVPSIEFVSWKSHLKLVESGRFDLSAGVWESAQFDGKFLYLENLTLDPGAFMVLSNSPIKDGKLTNFHKKRVGLIDGGGYPDVLIKNSNIIQVNVENMKQLVNMLENKRIDAIYSQVFAFEWILGNEYAHIKKNFKILEPALVTNYLSPAISRHHPNKDEIVKRYNASFKRLVTAGLYQKMQKKHRIKLKPRFLVQNESQKKAY